MIILILIFCIIIIYSVFFIAQAHNIFLKGYAPFISTNREISKKIVEEIKEELGTVYELGCGNANFLREIEKKFPKADLIGIENLLSIFILTKIKLFFCGSKIKLLKKDFFDLNFKNIDLIYCYLNNSTMKKLGEIFERECDSNTIIISQSFPIPQYECRKVLKIKGKTIYFYKT